MVDTSSMYTKGLAFFALLLCISSSVARPVEPVTHLNESFPVGPRPHEKGRFIYTDDASGNKFYCKFCPLRAVTNTEYQNEQQGLCSYFYQSQGSFDTDLTPYEKANKKYPICKVGEFPGCGEPLFNTTWGEWDCKKVHGGPIHSVYSTCHLKCQTDEEVVAQIYCNESLVWNTDYRPDTICSAPSTPPNVENDAEFPSSPSVEDDSDLTTIAIGGGIGVVGILVALFGARLYCYCRKKMSPSQQSSAENLPLSDIYPGGQQNGVAARELAGGGEDSERAGQPQRILSNSFASIGTCSLASAEVPEDVHPEPGESDKLLPDKEKEENKKASKNLSKSGNSGDPTNLKPAELPEVRVFHINSRYSHQENLETSCRLQENAHSVPRGSTFYIVPSSPGGRTIVTFNIVRKGEGQPYRGQPCPELGLDFFHTVENATNEDAGIFTWHITLQNGTCFQRDITIFISAALDSSEKTLPSIQAQQPPDIVEDINYTSGEKSIEACGRPEPEGREAEPQVRSTAKRPPGFSTPPPSRAAVVQNNPSVQQDSNASNDLNRPVGEAIATPPPSRVAVDQNNQSVQHDSNVSNDLNRPGGEAIASDSLPHLNINSSLANSRQPSSSLPNSRQPLVDENAAEQGIEQVENSRNIRVDTGAARLRGEILQSSVGYGPSENSSGALGCGTLGLSSMLDSEENPDPHLPRHQEHCSVNTCTSTVSHLNPNSISRPSYGREDPSGISHEVPLVEHARAEQVSSDFNSFIHEMEGARGTDEVHQTDRKNVVEGDDQCITPLCDVHNLVFLERLCDLADPRDHHGDRKSWFGFGRENGIDDVKLRAIEYHRRGSMTDGPMRYVMRDLGNRGKKMCDLVGYFINNYRHDIVNLSVNDCPDHVDCHYCKRMSR